jgi:hypothetical protein
MELLAVISLVSSIASLVLAIVAIWISFYQKKQTDSVNHNTQGLLNEISTNTKLVTQIVGPELQKYGDAARKALTDMDRWQVDVGTAHSLLANSDLTSEKQKELESQLHQLEDDLRESQNKLVKSVQESTPTHIAGPGKSMMIYPNMTVRDTIENNLSKFFSLSAGAYGITWWLENRTGNYRIHKTQYEMTFGEIPEKFLCIKKMERH